MKKYLPIAFIVFLAVFTRVVGQTSSSYGRLINLSTRGFVGPGDSVMILGFNIAEDDYHVLARAIGPTLSEFGVSGVLAQPTMEIFDSQGRVFATNTEGGGLTLDIRFDVPTIAQRVGAFAVSPTSRDCAIYLRLRRGSYTMVIRGANNTTGNVLAEIYGVPNSVHEQSVTLDPEKANKAPEPTPRPVTIRAEPRIAPGRVVAHL